MVDEREDIRQRVADDYFFHPRTRQLEFNDRADGWILRDYWQWAINGQVGPEPLPRAPIAALPYRHPAPPPAPVQDLARLARDSQNVHTRVVSEQTNKASLKLLTVTVPKTQSTETVLALVWLPWLYTTGVVYSSYLRVANDMHTWFNTKTCRTESDYLYRQLLRGLVAFINAEKDEGRKLEMFKRLWEESEEAVGMCCEGHITRLCNVLVGFDDDFEASVSLGELIQQKMAAIAGLDVSEEEKRKQASVFFDEHKVPDTDRAVWLDAF
jgi:hypothetical protein